MSTRALRRSIAPFGCLLFACAVPACSTSAPAECGDDPLPGTGPAQRVIAVDESLAVVQRDFNAHADQWRAVLLVSPTCSECVLGAKAVESEIMARYPAETLHATVVWVKMMRGDSASTASAASTIIPRPNATHFYDDAQLAGRAYSAGPYADMARRAKAQLPSGHYLLEAWPKEKEGAPQWDLYMLYAPGVRWPESGTGADIPPMPTAWVRHVGRKADGLSVYWRDTPDTPPREGNLHDAMHAMADETLGKSTLSQTPDAVRVDAPTIEFLYIPDCPNARELNRNLKSALGLMDVSWIITRINQTELPESDPRRGYPSPTILIDGRDLDGLPTPTSLTTSCRVYSAGPPGPKELASKLKKATAN